MFELAAPYPALQTKSLLPNPTLSDQKALTASISAYRSYSGATYTYIKRGDGRKRFSWTFRLSRPKGAELEEFYYSYFGSKIQVTDHNGNKWLGYFINNPFESDTPARAAPSRGDFNGEFQTVLIEFEGTSA